jgi:hypothetical protein
MTSFAPGVVDAGAQTVGGESAEHDGVDRTHLATASMAAIASGIIGM